MKTRPTEARRATAATALIAGLALTGCSAINYQATTNEYSASDGVIFETDDLFAAGSVEFNHIMFVAAAEGEAARMIGQVNNDGSGDAKVQISVEDETLDLQLEPGEAVNLEHDEELVVSSIGAPPGSMQEISVAVSAETPDGTESTEVTHNATVLDGALSQYRDLLPNGYDESMTDHLEHGPDTYGGGAAHHGPDDDGH